MYTGYVEYGIHYPTGESFNETKIFNDFEEMLALTSLEVLQAMSQSYGGEIELLNVFVRPELSIDYITSEAKLS